MAAVERFVTRGILNEGGMGIVYRAFDTSLNREVALKTIRDPQDRVIIDLFKRECSILASIVHPNIIEIFDTGETEISGFVRPYFVMPLLRGVTLADLVREGSPRLTVERSVNMIAQACRGLQAAHDKGLVHRDLKPSNLFILDDDSLKIIDFGVAYLMDHASRTGIKGTPLYMSPEQLRMQQPDPLSDQFSIAVVCYEVLSRRHPFRVAGYADPAQATLSHHPRPVLEYNSQVNFAISQVIHKALAKEPLHRFASVREFADSLQMALRNEPIQIFDPQRLEPQLKMARDAFERSDLETAAEVVEGLKAEFFGTAQVDDLSREIEAALRRQKVQNLMASAVRKFDGPNYLLALRDVHEVLSLDSSNVEAYQMKGAIESRRSENQVEEWYGKARQHLEVRAYAAAKQALEKVLDMRPNETRATALLPVVERWEQEHNRLRAEENAAYASALKAYENGDLQDALAKLGRIVEIAGRTVHDRSSEQIAIYQRLFDEVKLKHEQAELEEAEARQHVMNSRFEQASAISAHLSRQYPNNPVFSVLSEDIDEALRHQQTAFLAKVEADTAAEPDLSRKILILEEARQRFPNEGRFGALLQQLSARRNQVDSIVGMAHAAEEQMLFTEALGHWETLRKIYPQYPELDIELERLRRRRDQQVRADSKGEWIAKIEVALALHEYSRAESAVREALYRFRGDAELLAFEKAIDQLQRRSQEARVKLEEAERLMVEGRAGLALEATRGAFTLDPHNPKVRKALLSALLKEASGLLDRNWRAAEPFVSEAFGMDPSNSLCKSLRTLIEDRQLAEETSGILSEARVLQAQGDLRGAIQRLDGALLVYPRESRLSQLRESLRQSLSGSEREELRSADLAEVRKLAQQSHEIDDPAALESIFQRTAIYNSKYEGDPDFEAPVQEVEQRLRAGEHSSAATGLLRSDSLWGADSSSERSSLTGSQFTAVFTQDSAVSPPPVRRAEVSERRDTAESRKAPDWRIAEILRDFYTRAASAFRDATAGFSAKPVSRRAMAIVAVIALVLLLALLPRNSQAVKTAVPTIPQKAAVEVVSSGQAFQVFDLQSGNDVTNQIAGGLPAGKYRITADRAGFEPVNLPFSIEPEKVLQQTVVLPWKLLPMPMFVALAREFGQLQMDGNSVELTGTGLYNVGKLPAGQHTLRWESPNGSVKQDITLRDDGQVELPEPETSGGVAGFVAHLDERGGKVRQFNLPQISVITAEGPAVPVKNGEFGPAAPGSTLRFVAGRNAIPMGELKTGQGGQLYAFIWPPRRRTTASRSEVEATPSPIQETAPLAPPKPAPDPAEEIRKKYNIKSPGATP